MPKPKKHIQVQKENVFKGRSVVNECHEHHLVVEALQKAEEYNAKLETKLAEEQKKTQQLASTLASTKKKLDETSKKLHSATTKAEKWYKELRAERQILKHAEVKKTSLQQKVNAHYETDTKLNQEKKALMSNALSAVDSLMALEKENFQLRQELSSLLEQSASEHQRDQHIITTTQQAFKRCCAKLQRLEDQVTSSKKIQKQKSTFSLLHKGVYTEQTRDLIRLLVKAGCSKDSVSKVIHAVLNCAGIKETGGISQWTVSQVLVEGYIAAQIQLGYEMMETDGKLG